MCNLHVENQLSQCSGRWTWEMKEEVSGRLYLTVKGIS